MIIRTLSWNILFFLHLSPIILKKFILIEALNFLGHSNVVKTVYKKYKKKTCDVNVNNFKQVGTK